MKELVIKIKTFHCYTGMFVTCLKIPLNSKCSLPKIETWKFELFTYILNPLSCQNKSISLTIKSTEFTPHPIRVDPSPRALMYVSHTVKKNSRSGETVDDQRGLLLLWDSSQKHNNDVQDCYRMSQLITAPPQGTVLMSTSSWSVIGYR